jgi:alkanesulfonate monooxygenase SsuD/methylene tetrahydromethanopterin reductase-like flavin-dependent oxidoreductase (luciferase family)
VKIVVHLADFGWPIPAAELPALLTDVAALTEAGGFDGLAVGDHLWSSPYMDGPETACLEAYSTLSFLAARSSAVRLMTLATGAHFRHPGLLAKTVTTLDVLSGGRAWLGIGSGHYQEECDGLGVPFPSTGERFDLLEDALEVCRRMWTGEQGTDAPYDGHRVHATRLLNLPQSLRRPHPPVLIAGDGERRTLPLVARYGDACSLRPTPDIPAKLDLLRRLCDDAGTDFDRIERTCAWAFTADDDGPVTKDAIEKLRWFAGMGIETVIARIDGIEQRRPLELLARHVVPVADEIETRR